MIKKGIFFMVVACIVTVCIFANSPKQITSIEKTDISKQFLSTLQSENEKEREESASNIQEQYSKLIDGLIEIVSKQIDIPKTNIDKEYIQHDAKNKSIILLGDLRAAKAVPVLLENLEYINLNNTGISGLRPTGELFVSVGALIKIGMPAVEPILDKLSTLNDNKREVSIYCGILDEILGSKLAKYRIQISIEETKDETIKKNLNEVLTYIDKYYSN